jgi:hypothetical protein
MNLLPYSVSLKRSFVHSDSFSVSRHNSNRVFSVLSELNFICFLFRDDSSENSDSFFVSRNDSKRDLSCFCFVETCEMLTKRLPGLSFFGYRKVNLMRKTGT